MHILKARLCVIYVGDSDVISFYQIYARHDLGQALSNVLLLWHHFLSKIAIIRAFSHFSQLIQFCSNKAINLHRLTSHSTPCCPTQPRDRRLLWSHFTLCTPCLEKTSHLWLAITLTHMNRYWYFLAEILLIKHAIKRRFTMPPQITCASALPGKTRNTIIT